MRTRDDFQSQHRRWPLPVRIIYARPRLFLSALTGTIVALALPFVAGDLLGVTCFLVGWDVGVALYLALAFKMFAESTLAHIHRQAVLQDEGGLVILVLTVVASAVSFGAVFAWIEIATRDQTFAPLAIFFLFITIMLSWAFINTMFALHYAHQYYRLHGKQGDGLIFPNDPEPTYWDFAYFAFAIGTSTQVSDVEVCSKRIRRTVMVHGIVAFFFNVTVMALTVGLLGDAIRQ